jgi:hypothetical protein
MIADDWPRCTGIAVLSVLLVAAVPPPAAGAPFCPPLPPPTGVIIDVSPSQAGTLPDIVANAPAGSTIRLSAGTYNLDGGRLAFNRPGVTLRSASGHRADVILDGRYQSRAIVSIAASSVTIADVTVARAFNHPVHITPPPGSSISGIRIYNVRVVDPGQQAIKINPTDAANTIDHGSIECSLIELTDQGRSFIRDSCYTGGIDAHRSRGWRVANNVIRGFWCPVGLSEHGIHFWRNSRDTVVERNVVVNNARGIGFGLGSSVADGHVNGVIRNNFVVVNDDRVFTSQAGFDVGIGLESATNAKILHNSVVSTRAPFSSIEWRWKGTTATITNNLTSHALRPRDGATALVVGNLTSVPTSFFRSVSADDLHVLPGASAALGRGVPVPAGDADHDIDGDARLDGVRDIGADQLTGLNHRRDVPDTTAWPRQPGRLAPAR